VVGTHPRERAAVAPHRGAHGVDDKRIRHTTTSFRARPRIKFPAPPHPCRASRSHGLSSHHGMEFMLATLGMIGVIVLLLVLLARAYPGSGADLLDWKPTRSPELEAQLEIDDVQQMIEAQNEYRRRRGAEELTPEQVSEWAREDEELREKSRQGHERRLRELEDELGVETAGWRGRFWSVAGAADGSSAAGCATTAGRCGGRRAMPGGLARSSAPGSSRRWRTRTGSGRCSTPSGARAWS